MQALYIAIAIAICWLLVSILRRQSAGKQDPRALRQNMGLDQVRRANVSVPNKEKEEWDIREATFLYQTRGLGADPCYLESTCTPQTKSSIFSKTTAAPLAPVAVALPDDFMNRIAEKGRNLKRSSECEVTAHGVVDKNTGQQGGYVFTVSDIHWISPTDVEVLGGLRVGATAGTSKTYYLKKTADTWQIVGEHLKSISSD